jgi:integrase
MADDFHFTSFQRRPMSEQIAFLESTAAQSVAAVLAVVPKKPAAFIKAKDSLGREVMGLWQRNGRFYCQLSIPGKGSRRLPLRDESNQPVETVVQAVEAMHELRKKKQHGELPAAMHDPQFDKHVLHYLSFIETTGRKKPKTIVQERSVLRGWVRHLGGTRLSQITRRHINDYVLQRKMAGVGNRTANYDVLALSNCLKFAKEEGWLSDKLPTEGYKRLKYVAPKRPLFTKEQLDHLCRVATQKNADGTPKYRNGELLADAIRFMRTTGARVTSALSTRWSDVDWQQRQVHLRNTKYDRNVVVDFSDELESVLKEMYARRLPDSDCMFPAASDEAGSIGSLRGTFEKVREEAGLPNLHFHDTRHFFASACVASGVDFMTISRWLGHGDGGMLVGRVYGHISNEHAQRAAKKVTFGNDGNQPKAAERVSAMDRTGALATTSAPPPPAAMRCV